MLVALAPRPREHGIGGFYVTQISPKTSWQHDALPTVQPTSVAASNHSACQNKHRILAWVFNRNIRLSFALRSEAAQLCSHRASLDLRFGTFHSGRALALRTLASTRSIYGASNPGPML